MTFRDFNHLLTTKPHEIHEVFISDLHLMEGSTLVDGFLALLDDLSALPNLKRLYILGDWFELWIGDDAYLNLDRHSKPNHWITPIVTKLKKMRVKGCHTLILVGNRDFLMRQPFCNTFAGELIQEPFFINFDKLVTPHSLNEQKNRDEISNNTQNENITLKKTIRLEHGDALCTDDKAYQRFRKYTRNPMVQWWFLQKPLVKRKKIASKLRSKSKQANTKKTNEIMDVNETAVQYAFDPKLDENLVKQCKKKNKSIPPSSDIIIHGHTHRPAEHSPIPEKYRYVLGDWKVHNANSSHEKVTAIIGVISLEKSTTHLLDSAIKNSSIDESSITTSSFEMFEFTWKK